MMTDDVNMDRSEDMAKETGTDTNTEEKNETVNGEEKNDSAAGKAEENSKKDENGGNADENKKMNGEDPIVQKDKEINELKEYIKRLAAEFDNYKKRTRKEKEKIYASSVADVVSSFLPVVDNIERALQASEGSTESIREGVVMIHRQMMDILANLGVKPIEAKGKKFNPDFHEAIAHIEDENYGENEIVEEFLKGYIYNDEIVIRHSVVKVAN